MSICEVNINVGLKIFLFLISNCVGILYKLMQK